MRHACVNFCVSDKLQLREEKNGFPEIEGSASNGLAALRFFEHDFLKTKKFFFSQSLNFLFIIFCTGLPYMLREEHFFLHKIRP